MISDVWMPNWVCIKQSFDCRLGSSLFLPPKTRYTVNTEFFRRCLVLFSYKSFSELALFVLLAIIFIFTLRVIVRQHLRIRVLAFETMGALRYYLHAIVNSVLIIASTVFCCLALLVLLFPYGIFFISAPVYWLILVFIGFIPLHFCQKTKYRQLLQQKKQRESVSESTRALYPVE